MSFEVTRDTMSEFASLTGAQRRYLRGLAHGRAVIVQIGRAGWSAGVHRELDGALGAHELVKVRARVGEREARDQLFDRLATETASTLVQRVGNVGVFYRRSSDQPRIILPAA
jgi:RNA-binding protein